jgi:osmotically inducible protein OsmC
MADAQRRAHAVWEGTLAKGSGTVTLESSGLGGVLPATWASRTARSEGKTSPEELIAAAHATCYSMALSHILGEAGTPPTRLTTDATCTFAPVEGGFRIASMDLRVEGEVAGIDAASFAAAAEQAKDGCPVSQALKGNVALSVMAELA